METKDENDLIRKADDIYPYDVEVISEINVFGDLDINKDAIESMFKSTVQCAIEGSV